MSGEALGRELITGVVGFAEARLTELRDAMLGDVATFATAAGIGGFVDDAGIVAADLTAARAALDLVPARVAAGDLEGAAGQLGATLAAIDHAATTVHGLSLIDLLTSRIDWAQVQPKGLARQLGLPSSVPALSIDAGALVFGLTAPGRSLVPAPLTLGFNQAGFTARLRVDGTVPALSFVLALGGMEAGVGGGPIASLLGGAVGTLQADIVLGVDTKNGLTVGGGAGPRVVLPARAKAGPLDLREVALEIASGFPDTIDIGSTISASIGGVIAATVDGAGLHVHVDVARALAGNNPLSVSLKSPVGMGLALDTGLVRGGGFLTQRTGGYGGALHLRLGPVEVNAVGLLTLEPSFALVVVMSIEFLPPIDLSFGFTLNAVGGVIGIEHRLDTDALRAGLSSGTLDHLMFPADPVAAAPAILSTLEQVFPVDPGSVVIGPMVELGWGRPVSFLTAQLGVILSLPDPKIVIIGRARIALPAPQLPIIDLRATLYGEITPDHLLILVSLSGSRIAGFTVSGDIGLLLRWGGTPEFAISAGGFHPRYTPPRELAGMRRLALDISPPSILTLRADSYFAVTSNSVQLGSRVELGADLGVADVSGYFSFDALVLFSPHFAFMIDVGIGLTVRVRGVTLLGIHIELHLEGPAPWRAHGSAEVEILWISIPIDVGPFTWGDDANPLPEPADPRKLVHAALHHNPGAWQTLVPAGADRVVRLKAPSLSETEVTVHPLGLFDVRQHAIPLETVVTHVGANPVPEGQRRVHLGVPIINGTPAGALSEATDLFSAGAYLDLSDDEKLSRPSFEAMAAGARIRPPGESVDLAAARQAELRYETFVCDEDGVQGKHSEPSLDLLLGSASYTALMAGSSGRSDLRGPSRYAVKPDPIVLADVAEVQPLSMLTVTPATAGAPLTYTHAAELALARDVQLARLGVS